MALKVLGLKRAGTEEVGTGTSERGPPRARNCHVVVDPGLDELEPAKRHIRAERLDVSKVWNDNPRGDASPGR